LLAALALLAAPRAGRAQDTAAPLRCTIKTIENESGVRVILEFSRKPVYEVRRDSKRVFITLKDGPVEPPFKKKDYEGKVLERIKFVEGFRESELVFYVGEDYASFSTFEMGEPFRVVLDLRRKSGPSIVVSLPGSGPAAGGAAGVAPGVGGPGAAPGGTPSGAGAAGRAPAGAAGPVAGSAAPPAVAVPEAPPRAAFVVVIDPGHGGEDNGARGPTGLMEKDVTLDIAKRLRGRIVAAMDADVVLTRDSDKAVALDERTAIANHDRADLFVSIHANSSRRGNARGSETYFLSYQATDDDSRAVAALENNTLGLEEGVQRNSSLEMILWDLAQSAFLKESSALAEIVQENLNDALGITNRGIKQAPFRVLMGATMPAVLIEVAFISNTEEEKRLRDAAFKDKLTAAIFDSVKRFRDKFVKPESR
ncbi:MAG TPA: N-acetylmuramoyl-L-alanine amidase, partial [Candidatus Polarisedimenticolia bacterium]|nr:N-acetylmuramoyl-L-alanine amidase [Candidatus Polarisedimenticolia bacterium]